MDWNAIKKEYVTTTVTYRQLSDKYGISHSQLMKRGAAEKWADLRKRKGRIAEEKMVVNAANREAKTNDRFFDMVDQLVDLTQESMRRCSKGNISPSALEHYANTITAIQKMKDIKSDLEKAKIDKLRKEIETAGAEKDDIVIDLGGAAAWAK